jgi:hypothetical protein
VPAGVVQGSVALVLVAGSARTLVARVHVQKVVLQLERCWQQVPHTTALCSRPAAPCRAARHLPRAAVTITLPSRVLLLVCKAGVLLVCHKRVFPQSFSVFADMPVMCSTACR